MAGATKKYVELAKAKVAANKDVVISANETNGGFTIAQRLNVHDGEKQIDIFVKGAIHINDVDGLYELRDALNSALNKLGK